MLIVHFAPKGMNDTKYAAVMRRLDRAGAAAPPGRVHHACYGSKDALEVVDVYDTMGQLRDVRKDIDADPRGTRDRRRPSEHRRGAQHRSRLIVRHTASCQTPRRFGPSVA
jgi:hypothetical protein